MGLTLVNGSARVGSRSAWCAVPPVSLAAVLTTYGTYLGFTLSFSEVKPPPPTDSSDLPGGWSGGGSGGVPPSPLPCPRDARVERTAARVLRSSYAGRHRRRRFSR